MVPMVQYSAGPAQKGNYVPLPDRLRIGFFIGLSLAILCLGIALRAGSSGVCAGQQLTSGQGQEICGEISADATWTSSDGTYHVTCDTALLSGVTLEIERGVEIRFTAGVTLTISGTLHAYGTLNQPITFTSDAESPAPGDWGGLRFVAGSSDSNLAWCVVEYGTVGVYVYAGPGETVGPAFSNCTVRESAAHGIMLEAYTSGCDVGLVQTTVAACLVEGNGGCGIYGYGYGDPRNACHPSAAGSVGGALIGSEIRQNQGSGIFLRAELDDMGHGDVQIGIEASRIWGNAGHGVYMSGDDPVRPRIENSLIYGNAQSGIYSDAKHEDTELPIVNNTIYGNDGDGVVFKRPAGQAYLANNIVAASGGFGLVCEEAGSPWLANNDLWLNGSGDYAGCAAGASDIHANPDLLDPAGGDFHLPFGSPCMDAGTSIGAPATDFDGIARPQGVEVDIGAHELWYQRILFPLVLRMSAGLFDGGLDREPAG